MKSLILLFITLTAVAQDPACGDGTTYANEMQINGDKRLSEYPRIPSFPVYGEGENDLEKLIEERLKVKGEGRKMIFRLNYMFTVTCDGRVTNFVALGDPKLADLTNIREIIEDTDGKWAPAIKNGTPVDCIFLLKKSVVGNRY